MPVIYDDRHRRVLVQLIMRGELTFEQLQAAAKMRRSDDQFGRIMGVLAKKRGSRRDQHKPVEWWCSGDTRWYRIDPTALAELVKPRQ